ncbi:MAG: hypothetical protein HY778_03725 [Betaproteobacteria bacterium]|nr:hypothetical protein [Betaproteobacteria bacterium]
MTTIQSLTASVGGDISAAVYLDPTGGTPVEVVREDNAFSVKADWSVSSSDAVDPDGDVRSMLLGRQWRVQAWVESISAGFDGQVGGNVLVAVPATVANGTTFTATIDVPANTLVEDIYEVVVRLDLRDSGNTSNIGVCGYAELPKLMVFKRP